MRVLSGSILGWETKDSKSRGSGGLDTHHKRLRDRRNSALRSLELALRVIRGGSAYCSRGVSGFVAIIDVAGLSLAPCKEAEEKYEQRLRIHGNDTGSPLSWHKDR